MPTKRILIDATGIVKTPTGLGKFSVYLLRSLFENKELQFSVFIQSNMASSHPMRSFANSNVHLIPVNVPVIGPRREYACYRLRAFINAHDCFHCLSSYLPAFGVRVPSLVTIHDLKYLIYPEFLESRLKAQYYSWIIRNGISRATYVIAVSHATRQDIEHLVGRSENVSVIHEAPTLTSSSPGSLPEILIGKEFFLFVGENRPHKNVSGIIKAYEKVLSELGNQCPLIVFAGARYEDVKKQHANKKFVFLDTVSEGTLACLYEHSIALVYPSFYEGFGLPILEAMAVGTSVITSNCSSMPEVAGDAALFVDPRNVSQIADAMISVVQNKDTRKQLVSAGKSRVRQFSWDTAARETIKLYETIS